MSFRESVERSKSHGSGQSAYQVKNLRPLLMCILLLAGFQMFRCLGDCDVIERIPDARLKELENADPSWIVEHLRANTIFDADKVHLMMDLAKEYVKKEIEARRTGKNTQ